MKFYCENKEEVLKELKTSEAGLSENEAEKRLEQNGKNRLEAAKGKSLIRRFFRATGGPDDSYFACCGCNQWSAGSCRK